MANNQAVKQNNSSIQVLKTLQVLLEGNFSMQELVSRLNENEKEPIFNNSVVSKYINTCRYCGIEIPKIQNKYFVTKIPFGINLSSNDVDLLNQMQMICQENFSRKINNCFDSFMKKISKFSNKNIVKAERGLLNILFEKFEQAIQDEKKIKLMLKNNMVIECIPLGITTQQKRTFFNIKFENKEKSVAVDRIYGLEILDIKFRTPSYEYNEVVFEISGALAKRYNMRENETMLEKNLDTIVVLNKGEDKDLLISRLLRYDSLCKIREPINYKEDMKKIINDTLANYGE